MDNIGLKASVAQVLVESIFRRAGYRTARRRPSLGADESRSHDLFVWKPIDADDGFPAIHRLARVAVEYREDVETALLDDARLATDSADVYRVFVTDNPARGRACFQVVTPGDAARLPWATVDLHQADDLDFLPRAVAEYDTLVRMTFPVMSSGRASGLRRRAAPRRPEPPVPV